MTPKRRVSATSVYFESMPYRLDESTGLVDYDMLEKTAKLFRWGGKRGEGACVCACFWLGCGCGCVCACFRGEASSGSELISRTRRELPECICVSVPVSVPVPVPIHGACMVMLFGEAGSFALLDD
jgi:hypothetical protein